MTPETARLIFLDSRSQYEIAEAFGVSRPTISDIKNRRTHRYVTEGLGEPGRFLSKRRFVEDPFMEFASYDLQMLGDFVGAVQLAQPCICMKCGSEVSPMLHNLRQGQGGCNVCGFKESVAKRTGSKHPFWREDSKDLQDFRVKVYNHMHRTVPAMHGYVRDHFWPIVAFWNDREILGVLNDLEAWLRVINHPFNIQYTTSIENSQKGGSCNRDAFLSRYGSRRLT